MKYYMLYSLGCYDDEKYCHTESIPEGFTGPKKALYVGGDLSASYPDDPYEVTVELDEDSPKHIKLGSYISTTDEEVMVHADAIDCLKGFNIGEVDFWPFTLLNHKGKVHSKDYCFVVPKQAFDGVNEDASEIDRCSNGIVIGVDNAVLDSSKLAKAPDMFRLNDLGLMIFSEPLAKKLEKEFTNFAFIEVEQS